MLSVNRVAIYWIAEGLAGHFSNASFGNFITLVDNMAKLKYLRKYEEILQFLKIHTIILNVGVKLCQYFEGSCVKMCHK